MFSYTGEASEIAFKHLNVSNVNFSKTTPSVNHESQLFDFSLFSCIHYSSQYPSGTQDFHDLRAAVLKIGHVDFAPKRDF